MNILLTGANGYIGKRILPELVKSGHFVYCCVRERHRFSPPSHLKKQIEVLEIDFLDENSVSKIPENIDGAYYLMHSMSGSKNYQEFELKAARNFRNHLQRTKAQHIIYLSGIINEKSLSKHLNSRKAVEEELAKGDYKFTALRAGIIIGSGSASFEIIRDLVEKLPLMITPKWLNTKCQPISVGDVIQFLSKCLFNETSYNRHFDIGSPDVLSYKEMLLTYASIRGLKRRILIVPVMTPKLSSYWLYFVTSTSYKLATALVDSMKVEVVCQENDLNKILGITPISYKEAIRKTLSKIDENQIISSWQDSMISGRFKHSISAYLKVPTYGCFIDQRSIEVENKNKSIQRIWDLGGENGWYYANQLWKLRGFMDKIMGGVGLRGGRTHHQNIAAGDALDFWRVLYANKKEGRLLLFAEMKLPGEAWLEFKFKDNQLIQTATFRPKGLKGRLYWYSVLPFHALVFNGLIKKLAAHEN